MWEVLFFGESWQEMNKIACLCHILFTCVPVHMHLSIIALATFTEIITNCSKKRPYMAIISMATHKHCDKNNLKEVSDQRSLTHRDR